MTEGKFYVNETVFPHTVVLCTQADTGNGFFAGFVCSYNSVDEVGLFSNEWIIECFKLVEEKDIIEDIREAIPSLEYKQLKGEQILLLHRLKKIVKSY